MIVGLSYLGDVRMGIAEDSGKIDRIAAGSAEGLRDIYTPLLEVKFSDAGCSQNSSKADSLHLTPSMKYFLPGR